MDREIRLFRSGWNYSRWIMVLHHSNQRMVYFPYTTRSKTISTFPLYLTLPDLPPSHLLPRFTTKVRLLLQHQVQHPLLPHYHLYLVILDLPSINSTIPFEFLSSSTLFLPFSTHSFQSTPSPRPFITPPPTPRVDITRTLGFPSYRSVRSETIRRSRLVAPLNDPSRQIMVFILDQGCEMD